MGGKGLGWGSGGRCCHDVPANADGEGAVGPVATLAQRQLPAQVAAGPVEDLVAVAMLGGVEGVVRVRRVEVHAVVGVGGAGHDGGYVDSGMGIGC